MVHWKDTLSKYKCTGQFKPLEDSIWSRHVPKNYRSESQYSTLYLYTALTGNCFLGTNTGHWPLGLGQIDRSYCTGTWSDRRNWVSMGSSFSLRSLRYRVLQVTATCLFDHKIIHICVPFTQRSKRSWYFVIFKNHYSDLEIWEKCTSTF